jgi:hypothetical protein
VLIEKDFSVERVMLEIVEGINITNQLTATTKIGSCYFKLNVAVHKSFTVAMRVAPEIRA